MKLSKKIAIATGVLSVFGYQLKAGSINITPLSPVAPVADEMAYSFFIDGNIGVGKVDVLSQITDTHFLSDSLDDSGLTLDVGIGYRIDPNWFVEVSVQNTSLDYLSVTNLYGSINYQFTGGDLKPYVGLVGGYSHIKWDTAPLDNSNTATEDKSANGYFVGGQIGLEYKISERISINTQYQYLSNQDEIVTFVNGQEMKHEDQNNFLIGVRYAF